MASFFPLYELVEDLFLKNVYLLAESIALNSSREQSKLQDEKNT